MKVVYEGYYVGEFTNISFVATNDSNMAGYQIWQLAQ